MVQTVQKIVKFPHAFLDKVVLPVVMQDRGCPDSAENREDSARVLGHGSCPSLCNDRCRMVETLQKTVESPQLALLLDKVVDVPVLATSWGSRGSAVAVPRLVCQLIMAMMSS